MVADSTSSPGVQRIESASNPRLRELIALVESSRERRRHGRSVLEGRKLIEAYLAQTTPAARDGLRALFLTDAALERSDTAALARRVGARVILVPERLLRRASRLDEPDGSMAIVDTPSPSLPSSLDEDVVYLDRLQDPGNLGTILRTCAAAGVRRVITAPGTVFCWSPKVLRASMGAHFSLAIHEGVGPQELWAHAPAGVAVRATVVGGVAGASVSLFDADLTAPGIWLFGAEGQGLQDALLADRVVALRIPQAEGVESLNVAAAAAVCLFEQRRQRLASDG